MLAKRLRTFTPKPTLITLRTRHNILTGNPVKVLEEFRHRLTKLYSAPERLGNQSADNFLNNFSLPTLTEPHMALMDWDI